MRPTSEMLHHERRRVAQLVPVYRAGCGGGGLAEYMTQWIGRGDVSPISTRRVCGGGSVSKCVTASMAAASARSFARILVWALVMWRVVRRPANRLVSRKLVVLSPIGACGGDSALHLWYRGRCVGARWLAGGWIGNPCVCLSNHV